jgi:hypothetical protein
MGRLLPCTRPWLLDFLLSVAAQRVKCGASVQVIIKEGDAGNEFYIIEKGSVACTKRMPIKP